ncbi:MAG: hypothetical protein KAH32_00300 [Chlamydiia bacterium]|nr:hypothetical protein [Chlamydiia bacterium]
MKLQHSLSVNANKKVLITVFSENVDEKLDSLEVNEYLVSIDILEYTILMDNSTQFIHTFVLNVLDYHQVAKLTRLHMDCTPGYELENARVIAALMTMKLTLSQYIAVCSKHGTSAYCAKV